MTPRPGRLDGVAVVTAGAMTANLAGYLLHLPASRWLGLGGYSEFASLLAVQLVLAVPALALQNVVAREVAIGARTSIRRLQWRCAALVAVIAAALIPVLSALLDVGAVATGAALLTAPVLVALAADQGILQGSNRFRELAVVIGGAGVARVAPAVVVLALGGGPAAALTAGAGGAAVAALGARWVVGGVAGDGDASVLAVVRASQVQLALIALSSLDLVVARLVLDGDDASRYALAAVATKIAFWLPQAVGVVLYPRMAVASRQALREAMLVLTVLGAVAVAGAAVAAPLAPLLAGAGYAPITGVLWAFALHGAVLALLQAALLTAIAADRTALALIAWGGLAVEVVAMLGFARSVSTLVTTAVICAALTTALVTVVVARDVEKAVPAPTEG